MDKNMSKIFTSCLSSFTLFEVIGKWFHSAQSCQGRADITQWKTCLHNDFITRWHHLAPLSAESDASEVRCHACCVYWTALSVKMTSARLHFPKTEWVSRSCLFDGKRAEERESRRNRKMEMTGKKMVLSLEKLKTEVERWRMRGVLLSVWNVYPFEQLHITSDTLGK